MVWNEKLKRKIPASWENKNIEDIADVYNGATPSSLTLLLPADLAEGEYTLTVTTQYGSAGHILKTPRSVSTQIWVGGKPADGGGDSESPDEI